MPPLKQQNLQISHWAAWQRCLRSLWDRNHLAICPTSAGSLNFCHHIQLVDPLGAARSSWQYARDYRIISLRHRGGMSLKSSLRLFQTWNPSQKMNVSDCIIVAKRRIWVFILPLTCRVTLGRCLSFSSSKYTMGRVVQLISNPSSL